MKISCEQTIFLRKKSDDSLENLLTVSFADAPGNHGKIFLDDALVFDGEITENKAEFWIDEPLVEKTCTLRVETEAGTVTETINLQKPKHYEIHLVQLSHHDPGYTDLMSHVMESHYGWIDAVLDEMDKRQDYPEDAKLRITIEQFWSLDYYLKHAPQERVDKLIGYIKSGDIELTALYANLITEQLGHEECYRALYPAYKFAKECGVSLYSASHCDIPGASWGLCRALCDAGIHFLAVDFPHYYDWGWSGLINFWDSKKVFGYDGPGACYWKSPDGKKILMWDTKTEVLEGYSEQGLIDIVKKLNKDKYPFDVYRITAKTSNIDNSCYYAVYADTAKEWNERFAYPHLVTSNNETFCKAFEENAKTLGIEIPEMEGDIPGQDYPLGAMSMADITKSARKTQTKLVNAEKILAFTKDDEKVMNHDKVLDEAWTDLLLTDDHAYGHHFPAGPSMKASYWEKGSRAFRAEADVHDVHDKALASIADRIEKTNADLRLIVFNPSSVSVSKGCETAMREFDNCGTKLYYSNDNPEMLKGYILNNRRRVNPEEDYWNDGLFDLVDTATGKSVPYYIDDLNWDDPHYYAPESFGLGSGTERYGFFEKPGGMKRILRFVAEDLPAFGYKVYDLVKKDTSCAEKNPSKVRAVDNGIYKISVDKKGIKSIIDKRSGKELLDKKSPYRLGDVLVRIARNRDAEKMTVVKTDVKQNSICGEIKLYATLDGAHEIVVRVLLWNGVDRIDTALHILHSAKPLQTMFMAFPFVGKGFKYEGTLCEIEPVKDAVPGAQSDFLSVKDYVRVKDSNILWNSKDTGVVALGELWPGYISPAHSCVMKDEQHYPLTEEQISCSGNIFAMLTANNFGTNFMCSQSFDGVYKFSFGAYAGELDDSFCALWGDSEQNPPVTQFTDRTKGGLPVCQSLITCDGFHCLMLKLSDDKQHYIARFWNHASDKKALSVKIKGAKITEFSVCDVFGNELESAKAVTVEPESVITVKFKVQ